MLSSVSSLLQSRLGRKIFLSIISVFVISLMSLSLMVYFLMSHSLEKKDRELILSKAGELQLRYERDGIAGLRTLDPWVFVRLESERGETQLIRRSKDDDSFNLVNIESQLKNKTTSEGWITIPAIDDEDKLIIYSRHLKDGTNLQVGKSTNEREGSLGLLLSLFFGVSIPLILITFSLGVYLSKRITGSIQAFIKTLKGVRAGELSSRMPVDQEEDEIGGLAILFNKMLEENELLILRMRDTVDDIAHDLKTPVTRFRGIAEQALQKEGDVLALKEAVLEAIESAEQMMELLNLVMDISEAEVGALKLNLSLIDLSETIESVCDLYQEVADDKKIRMNCIFSTLQMVKADHQQIQRVFANLLDNAIKYTDIGGIVTVEARSVGLFVEVSFKDTGMGIDEKDIPLIWNRHFRGDRSRSKKGLGLGLSLVRAIILAHGGIAEVASQVGQGSVFTVKIPISQ